MIVTEVATFYLSMPEVSDRADGTQDTFLVRLRTDTGLEGWGESDAPPLVSMACYWCPPSHSNIVPLSKALVGARLDSVEDLHRVRREAITRALDIQQVHHAFSAADIALWDLLGKRLEVPVYELLDGPELPPRPKQPYASSLFGATPDETRALATGRRAAGFRAAKFGWGPFGVDRTINLAHATAAREGLGPETRLFIDAGWAWGHDADQALAGTMDLADLNVSWLEEPLLPDAIEGYRALAQMRPAIPIAAGESSGSVRQAEDFVVNGGVNYLQIDAGRIGGITAAHAARRVAERNDASYVNHTFKSHLSLAAALHVFTCASSHEIVEYAVDGSPLSANLVHDPLLPAADGTISLREEPGLGVEVDRDTVRRYLTPVEVRVAGRVLELGAQEV
jgi:L-alanine-DL-glutamate epimerase-like enolase superfamily enzyme